MDYSKLRGRIIEKYGSVFAFARKWGKTRQSVDNKLHFRTQFSQKDIAEVSELLQIEPEDIGTYFFTREVRKCE